MVTVFEKSKSTVVGRKSRFKFFSIFSVRYTYCVYTKFSKYKMIIFILKDGVNFRVYYYNRYNYSDIILKTKTKLLTFDRGGVQGIR